jgi:hypothetical protein
VLMELSLLPFILLQREVCLLMSLWCRRGDVDKKVVIGKMTEYRASQPPELQFQSRPIKIRIVGK